MLDSIQKSPYLDNCYSNYVYAAPYLLAEKLKADPTLTSTRVYLGIAEFFALIGTAVSLILEATGRLVLWVIARGISLFPTEKKAQWKDIADRLFKSVFSFNRSLFSVANSLRIATLVFVATAQGKIINTDKNINNCVLHRFNPIRTPNLMTEIKPIPRFPDAAELA